MNNQDTRLLDEYIRLSRAIARLNNELNQEETAHKALYLEAQALYQRLQAEFNRWWPPLRIKTDDME